MNNAGEPEPTTTFWMYTSIWIRISTCDRSNSMVMRCNDRCSQPIDKLIAERILRYDRTILELSFLSTHTSVWNVFYPVASHAYYVTFYFRFTFFYLITRGCSGKGDGLLDPNFFSDTQTFMRVRPNVRYDKAYVRMRDTYLRDHAAHNREKKISCEENQRMGGASQARVPQRTPGWVLWTVEEILNNAGEPEPTTTFWMYTSMWIRISNCDRSNSMVMRCNNRCS